MIGSVCLLRKLYCHFFHGSAVVNKGMQSFSTNIQFPVLLLGQFLVRLGEDSSFLHVFKDSLGSSMVSSCILIDYTLCGSLQPLAVGTGVNESSDPVDVVISEFTLKTLLPEAASLTVENLLLPATHANDGVPEAHLERSFWYLSVLFVRARNPVSSKSKVKVERGRAHELPNFISGIRWAYL
jgi:hypothetical protein